ncbi:PLP-dependent aminotransferase family protein [Microbacterium sp.]|uniref:MocR-like transcription factor YczR n=1 Tax=Microbacterium sp. TaxID=51671 RepID=UPI0039E46EF7
MDSRISARALAAALGGWRTRTPAYEALADGIRLLCLDNRLAPRTALPAERELAAVLGLSRATVTAAYRSLRESGQIDSLRGAGSITLPLRRRAASTIEPGVDAIDLQQASPAAWPGLAGVMSEVAQDAATLVARAGYDVVGSPALRTAIAERYTSSGLPTSPAQIMVTTGAQSAIHLIAGVFLRRGDRALIETPTYPHAADALRAAGARLVEVPVTTGTGWDLDRAAQALARTSPAVAYLMPRFQNPTGRTMSRRDQECIALSAQRSGTLLIVDDTTADLAIDAPTAEMPFAGPLAERTPIVRVGSLSKTVWGGLRIGWIRAELDDIRRLASERPRRDLGTPEFEQAVAERLFPLLPEIVAQRSVLLREGRDALVGALRQRLPEWTVPSVGGGVSLWVELGAPLSGSLLLAARPHGVHLSAGPRFAAVGGHDRHLRLPFTSPADELRRAVDVLAEVWPAVRLAAPDPTAAPEPAAAVV